MDDANNMTDRPLNGTIAVETQPMLVPRPVGYGVKVAGKIVATLTPEAVETAYLQFRELTVQRDRHERMLRGDQSHG